MIQSVPPSGAGLLRPVRPSFSRGVARGHAAAGLSLMGLGNEGAIFGGCRDLVIHLAAVLEDIGVIEHRGTARQCQLPATDQYRGARIFRGPASPDAVVRLEPGKQVRVLPRGK